MTKLLIACAVLLSGCDLSDMASIVTGKLRQKKRKKDTLKLLMSMKA